jgi:threonine/homoserine/homoserine lactone efflux protein
MPHDSRSPARGRDDRRLRRPDRVHGLDHDGAPLAAETIYGLDGRLTSHRHDIGVVITREARGDWERVAPGPRLRPADIAPSSRRARTYVLSDAADAATDSTAEDTISWGKIVFGVLLLLLALRNGRSRPAPGDEPEMPRWMAGINEFSPGKAFGLAVLLGGLNPKNLILAAAAAAGLAQLGLGTTDVVVSLIVFVAVGSLTIAGPVAYYLLGGDRAREQLDSMRDWLGVHNAAVMTVLFLFFGST